MNGFRTDLINRRNSIILIKVQLAISLISGVLTSLIFLVCLRVFRDRINRSIFENAGGPLPFEVFNNGKKAIAWRPSKRSRFWLSLGYCFLYYWGSPIYIIRYGLQRTAALMLGPYVVALILTMTFGFGDGVSTVLYAIPLRVLAAIYIYINDDSLWRESRLSKGWTSLGTYSAPSRKEAIKKASC